MAWLGRCWSKQHHHLCHRSAHRGIRITSWQSFLHRTLCKQSVELATESPDCEHSISPAIPYLVVRAVRAWPHAIFHNKRFHGLLCIPPAKRSYRKMEIRRIMHHGHFPTNRLLKNWLIVPRARQMRCSGHPSPSNFRMAAQSILGAMAFRQVPRRRVFHRKFCGHRAGSPFLRPSVSSHPLRGSH
jgi:hypothetical protein